MFKINIKHTSSYPIFTIKNKSNKTFIELYSFGGLLNQYAIFHKKKWIQVIDKFKDVEDCIEKTEKRDAFKSAKLSPFVCRLHHGQYSWANKKYTVEKNYNQSHALHGILFDQVYHNCTIKSSKKEASITFHSEYNGYDKGYPFPYQIDIEWTLDTLNMVSVKTTITNLHSRPIPICDGWHPYFTLSNSINNCTLQIDSDTLMEFDATLIPTGKEIKDKRFLSPCSLKDVQLDNAFKLSQKKKTAVILKSKSASLEIISHKSYPFLQIYTPPHRKSIAIENISALPDAFNNKIGLTTIKPKESASFKTHYLLKGK